MNPFLWILIGFSLGAGWQEFCHWKMDQIKKKIDALRREISEGS